MYISLGDDAISVQNLKLFLQKNGYDPKQNEIDAIFRRIEIILDEEMDYQEFLSFTSNMIESPKEPTLKV